MPVERTARHNYLQILSHLQFYKEEAFTKVETWNCFAKKLAKILEIVSQIPYLKLEQFAIVLESIFLLFYHFKLPT